MELSKQMPKSKVKKIKPVIAWAIVEKENNFILGVEEGLAICLNRKEADYFRKDVFRIAKIEIREIK